MRASPDVESLPPEPLPTAQDAPTAVPVRGEGATWTQAVSLALAWGLLFGLVYLSWGRIAGMPGMRRVPVDLYLAVATLALVTLGMLAWTVRRMARRGRAAARARGDSQWAIAGRHFRRNRMAMVGLAIMILLYLVTLLTPLIAPYDPAAQEDILSTQFLPPSGEYLMGTDKFGRDIFSRVLYGARISLSIGFIAVGISITLGTTIGAVSGYFGGLVDSVLMRFTDMMLSFPRLVLLIVVIALFEPSIWLVVTVLGLTGWMGTARIVRGEVLSLREREFVQAARALGMGDGRIIMRHVIPNTLAPVIVSATLGIGQTILTEASLSFLGLGVQPPTPSWGNMVSDGRDALITAWWIATFPGLAIVFTVIAFNLLGDGLRDALDPRLRT
ncbi:MAG TPA: oligopeptide ABC transporter permease [Longimicrobiaceae bacterium]|nr:oligopeptide ABC transporter permease [Longimicrobiaceae bacterium]